MRKMITLLVAMAVSLTACDSDPTEYQVGVSDNDRRQGAEVHPQLLAEFGGAFVGPEAAYVARLGEKMAQAAELSGQCNFTLVNSDVVNAFAVPGCYIYVTRGLMSIVNSEAELASIIAHELGHIVANHSGRQQSRLLWRQLGVIAVGLVTNNERLTRMAGKAAEFFTLRYSREQEYESDDLGIGYLKAAGYDPHEAADMLGALTRQERFLVSTQGRDEAKRMPEWARTHPLTENRIERARATAAATGVANDALPEHTEDFLNELDGLLYGDDPQQGFVIGRRFAHPVMRIGFEAPPGFTLTNSPQAILLEGPNGMRGEFGGGTLPSGDLRTYVDALISQMLGQTPKELGQVRRSVVNGLEMLELPVSVQTQRGSVELALAAYARGNGEAYHFVVARGADASPAAIAELFRSFRILTVEEVSKLRARVVKVVPVAAGETSESIARLMASDHPLEQFQMLNPRPGNQALRPGERVKIVTYADR